jgi:hypothetical protein
MLMLFVYKLNARTSCLYEQMNDDARVAYTGGGVAKVKEIFPYASWWTLIGGRLKVMLLTTNSSSSGVGAGVVGTVIVVGGSVVMIGIVVGATVVAGAVVVGATVVAATTVVGLTTPPLVHFSPALGSKQVYAVEQ